MSLHFSSKGSEWKWRSHWLIIQQLVPIPNVPITSWMICWPRAEIHVLNLFSYLYFFHSKHYFPEGEKYKMSLWNRVYLGAIGVITTVQTLQILMVKTMVHVKLNFSTLIRQRHPFLLPFIIPVNDPLNALLPKRNYFPGLFPNEVLLRSSLSHWVGMLPTPSECSVSDRNWFLPNLHWWRFLISLRMVGALEFEAHLLENPGQK